MSYPVLHKKRNLLKQKVFFGVIRPITEYTLKGIFKVIREVVDEVVSKLASTRDKLNNNIPHSPFWIIQLKILR